MKPPVSTPAGATTTALASPEPASLTLLEDSRYGPTLPALPPATLIVGEAPSVNGTSADKEASPLSSRSMLDRHRETARAWKEQTRGLVIRLRFEEHLAFPEIARRLGVTRAWIYKIAAEESLRRGKDKGAETARELGCLVCGVAPKPLGKLRANGLCGKHAHRLEKYGDAEIELPCDRPSVCQSCGVQCGQRGAAKGESADTGASTPRMRSGRILGTDGVYRCQRCAWREDVGFRSRHRESAKKWKARVRGLRILGGALERLSLEAAAGRITYEELTDACGVLNVARLRVQGEKKS